MKLCPGLLCFSKSQWPWLFFYQQQILKQILCSRYMTELVPQGSFYCPLKVYPRCFIFLKLPQKNHCRLMFRKTTETYYLMTLETRILKVSCVHFLWVSSSDFSCFGGSQQFLVFFGLQQLTSSISDPMLPPMQPYMIFLPLVGTHIIFGFRTHSRSLMMSFKASSTVVSIKIPFPNINVLWHSGWERIWEAEDNTIGVYNTYPLTLCKNTLLNIRHDLLHLETVRIPRKEEEISMVSRKESGAIYPRSRSCKKLT